MILSNIPPVIDTDVDILEVGLRPEVTPAGGPPAAWTQLYRLQDLAGLPELGGDAVHFFGPARAAADRTPFVLVYDRGGELRFLLMKESPDHPWVVDLVADEVGLKLTFLDDAHRDNAAALLRKLTAGGGLSETESWDLIRALRQGHLSQAEGR